MAAMDHLPTWRAVRNPLWTAAALVIVVQGLAEAQQVLLPIVTAIMLAIIVAPAVRWLEQHRVPRVAAVLAVVLGMMAVLAGVGALIGGSVASFTQKVDFYKAELADKGYRFYMWLQAKGVNVTAEQLKTMVDPGAAAGHAMQYVGKTWNAATTVLSNTILVMLTMVLILLEGATVPAKLRALSGAPDADLSHFNRIAVDVQRYLGIKTALSLGTGVLIWLWCTILGVDFALLWGLLAFLLNYIPNIGSIIAAVPAVAGRAREAPPPAPRGVPALREGAPVLHDPEVADDRGDSRDPGPGENRGQAHREDRGGDAAHRRGCREPGRREDRGRAGRARR